MVQNEMLERQRDSSCDDGRGQDEEEDLQDKGVADEGVEGHANTTDVSDELEDGTGEEVCSVRPSFRSPAKAQLAEDQDSV